MDPPVSGIPYLIGAIPSRAENRCLEPGAKFAANARAPLRVIWRARSLSMADGARSPEPPFEEKPPGTSEEKLQAGFQGRAARSLDVDSYDADTCPLDAARRKPSPMLVYLSQRTLGYGNTPPPYPAKDRGAQ